MPRLLGARLVFNADSALPGNFAAVPKPAGGENVVVGEAVFAGSSEQAASSTANTASNRQTITKVYWRPIAAARRAYRSPDRFPPPGRSKSRLKTCWTPWVLDTRLTTPRSPTTTGKIEPWHKTLLRELVDAARPFPDIEGAQVAIDAWVHGYNHTRPLLGLATVA